VFREYLCTSSEKIRSLTRRAKEAMPEAHSRLSTTKSGAEMPLECAEICQMRHFDHSMNDSDSSESAMSEDNGFEPVLIGFCCNWCAYAGADLAGTSRIQYPANIRIIRVMCSGMVHPNIVVNALTKGADGVLVCG